MQLVLESDSDDEVSFGNPQAMLQKKIDECEKLSGDLVTANDEISSLREEIAELERRLDTKSEETERIRLDLHNANTRLADQTDTSAIELLRAERRVLKAAVAEEKRVRRLADVEALNLRRSLQAKIAELEAAKKTSEAANAEAAQCRLDLSKKEDEVMTALVDVASMTSRFNEASEEAVGLRRELEEVHREVDDLRRQLREALDKVEAGPSSFFSGDPTEALVTIPDLALEDVKPSIDEIPPTGSEAEGKELCLESIDRLGEYVDHLTEEEKASLIDDLSIFLSNNDEVEIEIDFQHY